LAPWTVDLLLREVRLVICMSKVFDDDTDTEALKEYFLEGKLLRSLSLERFRETFIALLQLKNLYLKLHSTASALSHFILFAFSGAREQKIRKAMSDRLGANGVLEDGERRKLGRDFVWIGTGRYFFGQKCYRYSERDIRLQELVEVAQGQNIESGCGGGDQEWGI
jgi:hypothetical protein